MAVYTKFWKNFLNFSGKASRREFWIPFVINTIIVVVIRIIASQAAFSKSMLPVQIIVGVLLIVPCTALGFRRLRDVKETIWLGGAYGLAIVVATLRLIFNNSTLHIVAIPVYLFILVMLAYCARPTKIE